MTHVTREQVIEVVRALPEERLGSLYDYALFLQTRPQFPADFVDEFGESVEEILADEAQWDEQFARTADKLLRLADEATEEYHAGRTSPLDLDDKGHFGR